MRGLVLGCAVAMLTTSAHAEDDTTLAYKLGEASKAGKVILDYTISGWNQRIDVNIALT